MTAVYPGGAPNTFVPSTEATDNMIVDFSRNPQSFPLMNYVRLVPVKKSVGMYSAMTVEEAGRILQTNLANHLWADGDDAPGQGGNTESFEFKTYQTSRYVFDFKLGSKAVDQASWDILAQHARIKAQQAMTARAQKAITLLTTSGNWAAANTSAVSSISGVTGKWDVSTTARKDIKRSIDYALDTIRLGTLSAVNLADFKLVMSPGCARLLAVSQEIVDMVKQSPDARNEIEGKLGPATAYGLPARLYGIEIVIEDTVKVTSKKGATKAASYVLSDSTPFLVARPEGMTAVAGSETAPSFSTISMFAYEEMTVESKYDQDNRVHKGRVVEDYDMVLTASPAGFLFTAAVG